MKILLVHNKYQQYGGEDVVFQSESELLKNNGNQVDYLLFDNKEIKSTLDKIISGARSVYNSKSAKALEQKIDHFQPDVIHVHNFFPLASPSIFFVAKKKNIPVVMTLHNYRLICPSATLFHNHHVYDKSVGSLIPFDAILKGVYRDSMLQTASVVAVIAIHALMGTWRKKVNRYIALSEFSKNKFLSSSLGIPEKQFFVKPNSVIDYGNGETVREDFFLFIGRLTEEKGIDLILKAFQLRPFNLVIIGDGPAREGVEQMARDNSRITYLGFQEKPVIMNYLKRAKGFIFSSKYYENLPLTIIESFSTGTPVIASSMGVAKEIVQDKINGLWFKPGDAKDLSEKISLLSNEKDLGKTLSCNARETYVNHYTPEKNYDQLMLVYREVIKERHVPIEITGQLSVGKPIEI
jgi:glycosyltransferase involved in cell wall biosynthesis